MPESMEFLNTMHDIHASAVNAQEMLMTLIDNAGTSPEGKAVMEEFFRVITVQDAALRRFTEHTMKMEEQTQSINERLKQYKI